MKTNLHPPQSEKETVMAIRFVSIHKCRRCGAEQEGVHIQGEDGDENPSNVAKEILHKNRSSLEHWLIHWCDENNMGLTEFVGLRRHPGFGRVKGADAPPL